MEKILLDTNMFIYIEDFKVIEKEVLLLTKRLFDSNNYQIVIHPKTRYEISKLNDKKNRNIFLSKIAVYKEIESPPKVTNDFNQKAGCHNEHDAIDNELLFAIHRNCAQYLITNDHDLIKKSSKVGLKDRVLSIQEALEKFKDKQDINVKKPTFINKKFLYELDIDDSFFDSLKDDYKGFDSWFSKKQAENAMAYVTEDKGKIKAFLMTKVEDETEDYSSFAKPFEPGKRLKVSTMKVADTGKRIGETFIKIIVDTARKEKVEEVYVTVFNKQKQLIDLFNEYGFKFYTTKKTLKADDTYEDENVLVKSIKEKENYYPFFDLNRKVFIVPIRSNYHSLLFSESEKNYQMNMNDMIGMNTASNSIKKAYLSDSNIKKIEVGSILLFYSSGKERAITSLGVVDGVFNSFANFDELYNFVRKRTAYNENELKKGYKDDKLVILFKLYCSFDKYVTYNFLLNSGIIKGPIQGILEIKPDKLLAILDECKLDKDFYLIKDKGN